MEKSKTKIRILTSIVLLLIVGVALYVISWSTLPPNNISGFRTASIWIVTFLATIVAAIVSWEIAFSAFKNRKWQMKIFLAVILFAYFCYIIWRYFSFDGLIQQNGGSISRLISFGLSAEQILVTLVGGAIFLFLTLKSGIGKGAITVIIIVLISIFLKNFVFIATRLGWEVIFWLILISIFSDTFAYFFGLKFGKHKMSPKISPKKSWEGATAGFFFTVFLTLIIGTVISIFNDESSINGIISTNSIFQLGPIYFWAYFLIAVILAISTQFGDLFFSAVKRKYKTKDFSNIFPGHGGISDRIDGWVFVILVFSLIYVIFF